MVSEVREESLSSPAELLYLIRQSRFFVELVFYAGSVFVVAGFGLGLMSSSPKRPEQGVRD